MTPRAQSAVLIAMLLVGAACLPLAALVARGISRIASDGYVAFLGGRPLPSLTQVLVVRHSHSLLPFFIASLIGLVIAGTGLATFRPRLPGTAQGHLIYAVALFAGPFLALLMVAIVLVAATLPLVSLGPITSIPR